MILLIDNYDSFTYNLVDYFKILGQEVIVFRNDKITIEEIYQINPDYIILSPGPCSPNESGVCLEIVRKLSGVIPILGVCLGHQVIGQIYGANIIKAPYPAHGKIYRIHHNQHQLYNDIPTSFHVTRYHSLIIEEGSLNKEFYITARTDDNIIMSISSIDNKIHGVQYHPESITTEHGLTILSNFLKISI